ncbi:hypothetical protein, partial [Cronobacter sakazakii]|uniref:hypothetical protein n=1 Tax=Cronobacter sakazakii TaxID=28141 RepID=UPI001C614E28
SMPPITTDKRQNEPARQADESENKRLTLKEESVIYATSRQQAECRVAPLFNNLSDNLCGHSGH